MLKQRSRHTTCRVTAQKHHTTGMRTSRTLVVLEVTEERETRQLISALQCYGVTKGHSDEPENGVELLFGQVVLVHQTDYFVQPLSALHHV